MPGKNVIKQYVENGYYHIYNRGVEKRTIYQDDKDYKVFLFYLKTYLSPPNSSPDKINSLDQINLSQQIKLLAFCLMPNHFHLLVWQKTKDAIEKLMRRIGTKYVMYFNKRYKRIGALFQNTYKAVLIKTDEQLLHLSRYIHLNPIKDTPLQGSILVNSYSSYKVYLGKQKINWIYPEEIFRI